MTVAVLGTGIMGSGMARNMRRAGLEVRAWNRTRKRADPLAADDIAVTDRPDEAIAGGSVVVTMMYDAASVAEVIEPLDAPAGTLWLQTSTVGIDGADRLADIATGKGWIYVDAPVLGTKAPADNGTLIVLHQVQRRPATRPRRYSTRSDHGRCGWGRRGRAAG